MSFSPSVSVAAYDGGNPFDVVYDNSAILNQPLYEGSAFPGTADTVGILQWRIRKLFYDANNNLRGWRWANGNTNFDKDWTLRASYTYTSL